MATSLSLESNFLKVPAITASTLHSCSYTQNKNLFHGRSAASTVQQIQKRLPRPAHLRPSEPLVSCTKRPLAKKWIKIILTGHWPLSLLLVKVDVPWVDGWDNAHGLRLQVGHWFRVFIEVAGNLPRIEELDAPSIFCITENEPASHHATLASAPLRASSAGPDCEARKRPKCNSLPLAGGGVGQNEP